jgi:hypothetical protein
MGSTLSHKNSIDRGTTGDFTTKSTHISNFAVGLKKNHSRDSSRGSQKLKFKKDKK